MSEKQQNISKFFGVTDINNNEKQPPAEDNKKTRKIKFQDRWLSLYPWLRYDRSKDRMFCQPCKDLKLKNTMAMGTDNHKTTTIMRHIDSSDHKSAISNPRKRVEFEKSVSTADSKEYASISVCIMAVYWLSKESIPLSKYTSLINFLTLLKTPNTESLKVNNRVNYSNYTTACDILKAISDAIDTDVTKQLKDSPVLTILTDESTDIAIHHKLVINARIVDPLSLSPKTLFLTDLRLTSGTGRGIFEAIQSYLADKNISVSKVTALGTDGAAVMTGKKEGLTGQFLRHNPHLINTHCSAHRVALCSEQAADGIPAMKFYQSILESLFYYFKKSPARCDRLRAVQTILDQPKLKCREVHQIRWLSFYEALHAIYKTLDSLLTFFSTATDATATGLKKKLSQDFFLFITYSMMDILQPIMKLSLFFQRKDVDIGVVQVTVDACLSDLNKLLQDKPSETSFLHQLEIDLDQDTKLFKGQHQIQMSKYQGESCRKKFISALMENITRRFPEKHLMTSMCILGMRPVTLLDDEQLSEWGNESLEILADFFGKKHVHSYSENGEKKECSSEPVINYEDTLEEWQKLKVIVKTQGYPRLTTASLWALLVQYHKDDLPNMIKLAQIALTHPIHTSDCERSFSAQNSITTPLRNRISGEHCDMLMRVMIEGLPIDQFDCKSAFQQWKASKSRAIFT